MYPWKPEIKEAHFSVLERHKALSAIRALSSTSMKSDGDKAISCYIQRDHEDEIRARQGQQEQRRHKRN
jgi:hypothetical protein